MKKLICATLALAAAGMYAATPSWTPNAADPDNIFTNEVHFSALPTAAADQVIAQNSSGNLTVKLPAGLDLVTKYGVKFQAKGGYSATLDLADATWSQPDTTAEDPYTQDGRFGLALGGNHVLQYAWLNHVENGAFRLSNALVTVSCDVNGMDTVDFRRGTFDFLAPNGTTNASYYLYIAAGASTLRDFRMNFHEGSTFLAPIFFTYGSAKTNIINFLGGSHHVNKLAMRVRDNGGPDTYARTRVNILGQNTVLRIKGFSAESGNANHHGYRVYVGDGATLKCACDITQQPGDPYDFVFDNAKLDSKGGTVTWYNMSVFATNATFSSDTVSLYDGRMELKDTEWTGSYMYLGRRKERPATLKIDGGSMNFSSSAVIGHDGLATGILQVVSGNITVADTVTIGNGVNAFGRLLLSDGEFTTKNNFILGGSGSSEMTVSGGRLTTPKLHFTWNDASTDTLNVLRQTGGEIVVGDNVSVIAANGSKRVHGDIILEGGVLKALRVNGGAGCSGYDSSKTGVATLTGNGGTLRAAGGHSAFIAYFNSAACGPNGLTVDSDYAVTIPQSFSDMGGETGELILTGSGTKTLSGTATTVSRIVVAGGTVVFASGARAASELIVTNGARVVFTDSPATIGITNFICGDAANVGVITASSGSTLDFGSAPVTLKKVQIYLGDDFAISETPYEIIRTTAAVSAASKTAWAEALGSAGFVDGNSYAFSDSESEGTTSLSMGVAASARSFNVTEGTQTVSDSVTVGQMESIAVNVDAGATLTLEGALSEGALAKTGAGRLYLENGNNDFMRGLAMWGGLLSAASIGSIGISADSVFGLKLMDGTFEYRGDGSTPSSLPGLLWLAAPVVTAPIGFKVESPLTVTDIKVDGGAMIKRGIGTLTFAPPPGTTMTLTAGPGSGNGDPASPYSIGDLSDDTGVLPTSGYMGFNVAEGEVRLVGDSSTTFKIQNAMIGVNSTNGRVQPSLAIDGAKVEMGIYNTVQLAGFTGNNLPGAFNKRPRLAITNGADVTTYNFICGRNTQNFVSYPTVTVDRATWTVSGLQFSPGYNSNCAPSYFVDNGSTINANKIICYGPSYFFMTNSVMQKNAAGDCTTAEMHGSNGKWFFGAGSTLALSKVFTQSSSPSSGFTIAFDGGTWKTGGNADLFHLYRASKFTFQTLGKGGLTLPVDDGVTLPVGRAISGEGGLVKTGAGTLAFETQGEWNEALTEKTNMTDSVSLAFKGLLDVREGAVTVAADACRTGGAYRVANGASIDFGGNALGSTSFAGAGEFSNFSASNATIASDGSGTAVPQFSSATLSGKTLVDFGHTEESPLAWWEVRGVPVARFSDEAEAPGVSRWKISGIGEKGVKGKFAVADGEVRVSLLPGGFKVFFK